MKVGKVTKKISKNVKSSINSLSNMGFIFMAILILLGAYLVYKYLTRKVESFTCFYEGFGEMEKPDNWKILDKEKNTAKTVERIETLPDGTKIYILQDELIVRMVNDKNEAYSYVGKMDDFKQSDMYKYKKHEKGEFSLEKN